jgi:pimeloyl-ACP methyl ester carboxylesterase
VTEPLELATLRWGAGGLRVLLIHGLTSNARGWWRLGAELARAGYEVTAPDLRGHGDSPAGSDYKLEAYAGDVVALGGEWDVVLGHSLGGAIAVIAQSAKSSFARRLLLEDPLLRMSHPAAFISSYTKLFEDPSAGTVLARNPRWHPQDARVKEEALRASSPEVIRLTVLENQPWDLVSKASALEVPTLLVAADPTLDALVGPDLGTEITGANSLVTFEILEGAGHSLHRDSYDAFWRLVKGFLPA